MDQPTENGAQQITSNNNRDAPRQVQDNFVSHALNTLEIVVEIQLNSLKHISTQVFFKRTKTFDWLLCDLCSRGGSVERQYNGNCQICDRNINDFTRRPIFLLFG